MKIIDKSHEERNLVSELIECMHCEFFWGHNNRCVKSKCCKEVESIDNNERSIPDICIGCPYYHGDGFCFPCMLKLIGK